MKKLLQATLIVMMLLALALPAAAQSTSTPTQTLTPTFTQTPTVTPTATFVPPPTAVNKSTSGMVSPILRPHASEWRTKSFSTGAVQVLAPAVANARQTLFYLDVVADGATTVTVKIGDLSIPVVFTSGVANLHQHYEWADPPIAPPNTAITASQSGTAAVVVITDTVQTGPTSVVSP